MLKVYDSVADVLDVLVFEVVVVDVLLVLFDDVLFANGGDRTQDNIPEIDAFDKDPRVQFAFGVGGTHKQNSSSWILKEWTSQKNLI